MRMQTVMLFAVFDSAAHGFLDPFPAPTVEFAIRGFREAVNKPGHQFQKFPEDYTLFHVGSFDSATGTLEALPPRSLGVAVTFVSREQLSLMEASDG